MKRLLLIFIFCLAAMPVSAQIPVSPNETASAGSSAGPRAADPKTAFSLPPEKAQPVRIPFVKSSPVIDGRLDDEIWKSAAIFGNFYQTQPGDNIAPSHQTEVLVAFDSIHLYIAFRARDEAGKVRANLVRRDEVFDDDNVRILLDTYNDQRKAYILAFNPFGIQADGIMTEGRGEDYSVDIVMESKGIVGDDGYVVEVAVPFKSLRYEAGAGKQWGFHAFRRIKRLANELSSWMPISRDRVGTLNQAGQITGLEGIAIERTLEVIPTITFSETGRRVPTLLPGTDPSLIDPGRFVNSPVNADVGISIKFNINPNLTLDFAANPDFAQVEADEPVVVANQRFPIFFDERRPFFLEGIDIFQTSLQPVHTRSIIDPDYAVKLTGRRGRNTFGLLAASDNAPGSFSEDEINDPEIFPEIEKFIGKNAYIGIARLRRDVGRESSLGLIATTYNFIERHNHLGGVDGRFRINSQDTFSFQALGTASRMFFYDAGLDQNIYRTGNGFAYNWSYDKTGRNFGYLVNGTGRTADYRANVGFTPRTNTNEKSLFLRFSTDPKAGAKLISVRVINSTSTAFNWQGRLTDWESGGEINFSFARNTFAGVEGEFGYERVFEEEFGPRRGATRSGAFFGNDSERSTRKKSVSAWFETNPSDKFNFETSFTYSQNVFDFDFGAGPRYPRVSPAALLDPDSPLDPGPANALEFEAEFSYNPFESLSASIEYSRIRLHRNDTDRTVFIDNIYSLSTRYQFTRFAFARVRIDYDTLESNVRGQYLFGWTPGPGTAFYAGYNDDLNYNGFSPFTGHLEPGFRRNNQAFFVKFSYLIRKSF